MSIVLMFANAALLALSAAALIPVATLMLQIVCARMRSRQVSAAPANEKRPSVTVLIPAHNEASGIERTLASVRKQLQPSDLLLVIADNCSDETSSVAARAGARVIERNDTDRIGKGYALDAGFKYAEAHNGPSIVIFIDADCILPEGSIGVLARDCLAKDRPIQCIYLMNPPANAGAGQRLSAFAWRVKNMVRPLGYHALSMPCLLTGTGMAIPSHVLKKINLATGHITEDTLISIDCALMGYPPTLCADAVITSDFAPTEAGRATQKKRWIHGQLSAIAEFIPKLVAAAYRRHDLQLLAIAANIAILPLGLLLSGLFVLVFVCFFWLLATGYSAPLILALIGLLTTCLTLTIAWLKAGRDLVGISEFHEIVRYTLRQLPIVKDFVTGRRSKWTRSEREQ